MKNTIYDFSGEMTDRAEISFVFDGVTAIIVIEDQNRQSGNTRITFSKVVKFEHSSIVALDRFPTEVCEKLVETNALAELKDTVRRNEPDLAASVIRNFRVYFEDIGVFVIDACTVEVSAV